MSNKSSQLEQFLENQEDIKGMKVGAAICGSAVGTFIYAATCEPTKSAISLGIVLTSLMGAAGVGFFADKIAQASGKKIDFTSRVLYAGYIVNAGYFFNQIAQGHVAAGAAGIGTLVAIPSCHHVLMSNDDDPYNITGEQTDPIRYKAFLLAGAITYATYEAVNQLHRLV